MLKYVFISFIYCGFIQAQEVSCNSNNIRYKSDRINFNFSYADDGTNQGYYMSNMTFTNLLDINFTEVEEKLIIDKYNGRYRFYINITSLENQTFKLDRDNLNLRQNTQLMASIKEVLLPLLLRVKNTIKEECSKDVFRHSIRLPIKIAIYD